MAKVRDQTQVRHLVVHSCDLNGLSKHHCAHFRAVDVKALSTLGALESEPKARGLGIQQWVSLVVQMRLPWSQTAGIRYLLYPLPAASLRQFTELLVG